MISHNIYIDRILYNGKYKMAINTDNYRQLNQNCVQLDLDEKVKEKIGRNYKENLEEIRRIKNRVYSRA